jgi:hypothetical protein
VSAIYIGVRALDATRGFLRSRAVAFDDGRASATIPRTELLGAQLVLVEA